MRTDAAGIGFRRVCPQDYPLLAGWLEQDHVRAWWGDPDEELALIKGSVEGEDDTQAWLALIDDKPVGYIQSWRPSDYARPEWLEEAPWLADVPPDTLGIDIFIGDSAQTGQGLGPAIIRSFAGTLFAEGAPRLIIDPDPANRRAVRAYEKAGFRAYGRHIGEDGATLLMEMLAPASRQESEAG